nr:MAG TPA: PDZ domain protein [Bacteriophage sp.]
MRTAPVRSILGGIHLGRGLSFFSRSGLKFYDVGGGVFQPLTPSYI